MGGSSGRIYSGFGPAPVSCRNTAATTASGVMPKWQEELGFRPGGAKRAHADEAAVLADETLPTRLPRRPRLRPGRCLVPRSSPGRCRPAARSAPSTARRSPPSALPAPAARCGRRARSRLPSHWRRSSRGARHLGVGQRISACAQRFSSMCFVRIAGSAWRELTIAVGERRLATASCRHSASTASAGRITSRLGVAAATRDTRRAGASARSCRCRSSRG